MKLALATNKSVVMNAIKRGKCDRNEHGTKIAQPYIGRMAR